MMWDVLFIVSRLLVVVGAALMALTHVAHVYIVVTAAVCRDV